MRKDFTDEDFSLKKYLKLLEKEGRLKKIKTQYLTKAHREELRLLDRQLLVYGPFIANQVAYARKEHYLLLIEPYLGRKLQSGMFREEFVEMRHADVDSTRSIEDTFDEFAKFLLNAEALKEDLEIKKERDAFSFLLHRIYNISVIANKNGVSEDEFREYVEREFSRFKNL